MVAAWYGVARSHLPDVIDDLRLRHLYKLSAVVEPAVLLGQHRPLDSLYVRNQNLDAGRDDSFPQVRVDVRGAGHVRDLGVAYGAVRAE